MRRASCRALARVRAMSRVTPATRALQQAGVAFTLHEYRYDPDADSIGLQAAQALGVPPARLLKTLMVKADGKAMCAVLPSDHELNLKKFAAAAGAKSAAMLPVPDAERSTGFRVGGISPFGQKKRVPVFVERGALDHQTIFVNGGQRGLQAELSPQALVAALTATVADLV